jgi:hypothetical protein
MTKKIQAIFDGKVLCPEEPVDLEINGRYILNIEPVIDNDGKEELETDAAYDISSLAVKTGISDLATEHDHYLYGTPKKVIDNDE